MVAPPRHEPPNPTTSPLLAAFGEFFRTETASGILLLVAAVLALATANSPLAPAYFAFWNTPFTIGPGELALTKPLFLWVNDGLMVLFFFVVGLEIKREILIGEVSTVRKAALPVVAAVGGMAIPASIYLLFNGGMETARGWGIPMATDIAFALGVLAVVGRGAPLGLKVFLTAVAIIDDLGAVLVIALFYSEKLKIVALGVALVAILALFALNRLSVRSSLPYALLGIVLWLALLKSGVHATIAGVALAMFIPAQRALDEATFLARARSFLDAFQEETPHPGPMPTNRQRDAIHSLEVLAHAAEAPLARLEHRLHPWVAFFVVPVFAFANAGVSLELDSPGFFTDPVTAGVALGLLVGKPVGILLFSWLTVRLGMGDLPDGVSWAQVLGVAPLCGIGFTMSLFIGTLAFTRPEDLEHAKVGILLGSLFSALLGAFLLRRSRSQAPAPSS